MKKIGYYLCVIFIASIIMFYYTEFDDNKVKGVKVSISNKSDENILDERTITKEATKIYLNKYIKEIKEVKDIFEISSIKNKYMFVSNDLNVNFIIEQREPICKVFEENKSYFLDEANQVITGDLNNYPDVILVTGKIDSNRPQLVTLVKEIQKDKFLKEQIIGIDINHLNKVYLYTLSKRQRIYFGDISDIKHKLNNLKIFYEKYFDSDKINNYKELNLNFKNQIIGKYE